MSEHITCEICQQAIHSVQNHLEKAHPEVTEKEYQARFPGAPLLSPKLQAKLEEAKRAREKAEKEEHGRSKISFEKAFKLTGVAAAKTPNGKDIMIDLCDPGEYSDMVPDWDDNYVPDIDSYKNILLAMGRNKPIYLYGMPGLGKSSIFKQVAAATKRPLVRVQHTVNTEESHIVGEKMPVRKIDEKTGEPFMTIEFQLGPLPEAMLNGWLYLADEYDRSLPQVLSVYQAVLEGEPLYIKEAPPHLRVIRPHPNFRFAATGNTNGAGDDLGLFNSTIQQDAATFERFAVVHRVDYMSAEQEVALICKKTKLSKAHGEQVRTFAEKIREGFPNEIPLSIGPRVLINLVDMGVSKGCFVKGVELAFANRLPDGPRKVALDIARRVFIEQAV